MHGASVWLSRALPAWATLLAPPCVRPRSYLSPRTFGISHRHVCLFSFQSLSPLWRMGSGAENSKLLMRLGLSGEQPPPRSPTRVISLAKGCSSHPGNCKGLRSPVSGTGIRDQVLDQKMPLMLLSLRKLKGF